MDPCPKGTAASYAGQSYWLADPSIVLTFPENWYTCFGDLEITPDQVVILLDPKGPNTLLVGTNGKWALTEPGKHVRLHFNFTISGSTKTGGWNHNATIENDATVTASTIVYGIPTVRSDSSLTPHGQKDQGDQANYDTGTHSVEVVVELTSNGGTCGLNTYGLHFG